MKNNNPNQDERGNAFIIVLVGVVMFIALSFTVSKGMRSDNTNKLSAREIELAASDILNYATQMERAINRMRRIGVSESEIDFANSVNLLYTNPNCATNDCRVFDSQGGNMRWKAPPNGANDGSDWLYNARNTVEGVGEDCTGSTRCTELVMFLNNMDQDVCREINNKLGISPVTPPIDGNTAADVSTIHVGIFLDTQSISGDSGGIIDGKNSLCFQTLAQTYHFYHVLIAR
jgi:hypothetical protein